MSAAFSWRDQVIPQTLQQQRGSQLVPPGAAPGENGVARPDKAAKLTDGHDADQKAAVASPKPVV